MNNLFQFNNRVEFKDNEGYFHIGYIKKVKRVRKGLFRKEWVYEICEYVKGAALRKVYSVAETDIFGIVEPKRKDAPIKVREHKIYNNLQDLAELK